MKDRVLLLSKKIITHELVKGSSLIFLGTMLANIFAFLFNLFLVRNFSYAEYGEFAAMISVFTLLSIPAQSLLPVLVRFSSEFIAKKQLGKAERFYKQTLFSLIILSAFFFLLYFLATPYMESFFHIHDVIPLLFVGFIICFVYISLPNTTVLQSTLQFSFLSLTTALGALTKLVGGILLIWGGFHVMGGLWAVWLSLLIPFFLSFIPIRRFFSVSESPENVGWREIISYGFPSVVALFALSSFTSTDVILIKHFFSTTDAGLYAGLSLVGKVIFYFTAPITMVMFPLVVKRYEEGKKFQNVFYLALLLVLLPSVTLTISYFFFPHFVIMLFLGNKYQQIVPYIGWFGIIICIFSVLNVLVNLFLSLKRTEVVYITILAATVQAIGINFFHKNFYEVIFITGSILIILFVLLFSYYVKKYIFDNLYA